MKRTAVIIGAGPAGLTAAHEFLKKTDIRPLVFEMSGQVGGISKTVNYKGNRIDIGGHRFFSKSDRIVRWWLAFLPLQGAPARDDILLQKKAILSDEPSAPDPEKSDRVMLVRHRLSRILAFRKFFDYPVSLSVKTLVNLGPLRVLRIGVSYLHACFFPRKEEKTLEDFLVNRFGLELYRTFFESYTEKVWGVPCRELGADWGAQRIKGLSIMGAVLHAVKKVFSFQKDPLAQKGVETSLIERFMYPKFGPGQMWEEVASAVQSLGGEVRLNCEVVALSHRDGRITEVRVRDWQTGEESVVAGDYFFSTMPVKDLVGALQPAAPSGVSRIAAGLVYRDFITVGLLVKDLKIRNTTKIRTMNNIIPDNWIYVQEEGVKLGRIQIFNNWSPYMVKDGDKVWIGLEYFCNEGDALWSKSDREMAAFAIGELVETGFINSPADVLDSMSLKVPKAYPSYHGIYDEFAAVRQYVDAFDNLFLIGRNGMHRYNNADHSMMTAMVAVENIVSGVRSRDNIWDVNMEKSYHE